jgi:hypothetical protein
MHRAKWKMSKATDEFLQIAITEKEHYKATTKHLGASMDLVDDLRTLYGAITPLLKHPQSGDISTSDETLTLVAIIHELMLCRILLSKSVLMALRMYMSESLIHLRRAIEACAFSVRMSKHPETSRKWAEGALDDLKYKKYRNAFGPKEIFPAPGTPDHEPKLILLRETFDHCSKTVHGSVLGMAGHVVNAPVSTPSSLTRSMTFFDMPNDFLVPTFLRTLAAHGIMIDLFAKILEPNSTGLGDWRKEYTIVMERLQRHMVKWGHPVVP